MNAKILVAILCASPLAACGAGGHTGFGDTGSGGNDAAVDGRAGQDAASDANTTGDTFRPVPDVTDPPDDGVIDPDAACATQAFDTTREPMNLLIVLDRSGSMADNGKWTAAVSGLTTLLSRLDDTVRVGLTFFPASQNDANINGYTTPAVPVAPLSTNRSILMASLNAASPDGGTPMSCAMQGSANYMTGAFTMDGTRSMVLITDGEPTDECSGVTCNPFDPDPNHFIQCEMDAASAAELKIQVAVSRAARGTPQVRTFVVGTPEASNSFLSNLAVNGATARYDGCPPNQDCHYSLGASTFQQDLNMALADIQGRAASCEFQLSIDPTMVNPDLINVDWTSMSGGTSTLVPRDVNHVDGWDYSSDMQNVILYGPICDDVRTNTTGGSIQILFGCPTIVPG